MSEKKSYQPPKNHVGYVSKSQAGNIIITVEQDIVLKKGDKLIQKKPAEIFQGLVDRGLMTEEKMQERLDKTPEWKLYEVTKMTSRD